MYLSVDVYVQHPLSQLEFYDGLIEEVINHEDIVNLDDEYLISKLYVGKGDETYVHEDRVHDDEVQEGELNDSGMVNDEINVGVMNEGGMVGSESGDDNDDVCFNYDSVLCHENLRTNSIPTIKLNVQLMQEEAFDKRLHFKRLYICYTTYKESFKLSRPMIGLDIWVFFKWSL